MNISRPVYLSWAAVFLFLIVICSSHAMADDRLDALFGPKLYDIDNGETRVSFVTKMCTADILQGEFEKLSGQIYFDRENPENSWAEVILDATSLSFDKESHGDHHIKTIVEGEHLLKTASFPKIKLKSTKIERTGIHTGLMTADMTLLGETHPITLEITFENTMTDRYAKKVEEGKVVFSAYGTFKRSDWGILYALDRVGIRRINDEMQLFVSVTGILNEDQK